MITRLQLQDAATASSSTTWVEAVIIRSDNPITPCGGWCCIAPTLATNARSIPMNGGGRQKPRLQHATMHLQAHAPLTAICSRLVVEHATRQVAGLQLTGVFTRSSKLPANVFKIHTLMLDVCWIVQTPYNLQLIFVQLAARFERPTCRGGCTHVQNVRIGVPKIGPKD